MDHLRNLKFINFIFAALMLLSGLLILLATGIPGFMFALNGDLGSAIPQILVGLVGLFVLVGFGVVYFLTGRNVEQGRWRIPQTILAVLSLGTFPIGTAYAAYALWALWMNDETKLKFEA